MCKKNKSKKNQNKGSNNNNSNNNNNDKKVINKATINTIQNVKKNTNNNNNKSINNNNNNNNDKKLLLNNVKCDLNSVNYNKNELIIIKDGFNIVLPEELKTINNSNEIINVNTNNNNIINLINKCPDYDVFCASTSNDDDILLSKSIEKNLSLLTAITPTIDAVSSSLQTSGNLILNEIIVPMNIINMIKKPIIIITEKQSKRQHCFPFMQSGTLEVPDSYLRSSTVVESAVVEEEASTSVIKEVEEIVEQQPQPEEIITNSTPTPTPPQMSTATPTIIKTNMDKFQMDEGFHSDGGSETPPPSPSSGSSVASVSETAGSLDSVVDTGAQRLAVLSFEQVRKLNDVMDECVSIHGRGNFPTLEVKLKDLVTLVRKKLELDVVSGGAGMIVKDIRLNGGAASHVLASEAQPYNDLDLIFAVEFSSTRHYDRVKSAVLNSLFDLLPEGVSRRRITHCSLKEAYVGKMVKVNNNNDDDRWSLISLGNSPGHKNVELKFVDTMRRQFEFSVDSFQIALDSLLLFYDCAALPISENFYPTVVGESVYGDFQEALYHLQKKLISTRQPEEIRGGGLLKYCNLLVRNYIPVDIKKIKILERYMCSRFFIDFPDIVMQRVKLEAYLRNHFWGADEESLQYQYLMHLYEVVRASTVCLMGHERRQTLHLIESLALQVLYREQQRQQHHQQAVAVAACASVQSATVATTTCQQMPLPPQPGLLYANGVYYAPVIPTTYCTCNSTWLTT